MPSKNDFARSVQALIERISACEQGFTDFILASDYPRLLAELETVQEQLSKPELFALIWSMVEQSEGYLRAGRIEDAAHALRQALTIVKG